MPVWRYGQWGDEFHGNSWSVGRRVATTPGSDCRTESRLEVSARGISECRSQVNLVVAYERREWSAVRLVRVMSILIVANHLHAVERTELFRNRFFYKLKNWRVVVRQWDVEPGQRKRRWRR